MPSHHVDSYLQAYKTARLGPCSIQDRERREQARCNQPWTKGPGPDTARSAFGEMRITLWFNGLTLTPAADGTTRVYGPVVGRGALLDLLDRVLEIGPLLSLVYLDPTKTDPALCDAF